MRHSTRIIRREHFNAAHRLHNPNWDKAKNEEIFGKCNNEYYHGHNYEVEVMVSGQVDEEVGYVIDAKILSRLMKEKIIDQYDHRNLNLDVEEFKNLIPSAENIAWRIYENLKPEIDPSFELKIRLYETPRNYVEYPA